MAEPGDEETMVVRLLALDPHGRAAVPGSRVQLRGMVDANVQLRPEGGDQALFLSLCAAEIVDVSMGRINCNEGQPYVDLCRIHINSLHAGDQFATDDGVPAFS